MHGEYKKINNCGGPARLIVRSTMGGFTMLFTVLLIAVITTISAGIANISLKQQILSRLASDSQSALYSADAGMECALYHYYKGDITNTSFDCLIRVISSNGVNSVSNITLNEQGMGSGMFIFDLNGFPPFDTNQSCFSVNTTKDSNGNIVKIVSHGYNICDSTNTRRVERSLEVTFL